jgi:outer membrane protein TolC
MNYLKSLDRFIRIGTVVVLATACMRPIATRAQIPTDSPHQLAVGSPGQTAAGGGVSDGATPNRASIMDRATNGPNPDHDASVSHATRSIQPLSSALTMRDAIQRGLRYNLNVVGLTHAADQARGRRAITRSALLPNLSADFSAAEQQTNLAAVGVRINIPGVPFEDVVRFNVVDLHTRLSQTVVNVATMNNYRAAQETLRASELAIDDSRDLIVLAVGGAYLEALAARARLLATRAQVETSTAIHEKTVQQQAAGLATPLDVNRAQVQILTARQRLAAQHADFAKRKINLARMIGLPPTDQYDLGLDVPFSQAPDISLEDALRQAAERRSDLKAADAQLRTAEHTLDAARAERLPTVSVTADYGGNRASDGPMHATYRVAGLVRVPIWEGGRTAGAVEQATAVLAQRRSELDDIKAQIEGDVRKAYLDIAAAATQVSAADTNLQVTRDNLALTRQRFDAGISDNISVVQSQEALAAAEYDYINGVFAHNVAKIGLARMVGRASEDISRYLQLP